MHAPRRQGSFSVLEVAVSLGIIAVLLAVLIPALTSARAHSYLQGCAAHQRRLAEVWELYLQDHHEQFPFVAVQPGWHYGGVRFSNVTGEHFLDFQRPLNPYVADRVDAPARQLFRCPADYGIRHDHGEAGTGGRTAYRSYGTSFRCNAALVDARIGRIEDEPRGVYRHEIEVAPSRLILMGDPSWYETYERTGRDADWHREGGAGNLLFLDGSVRFMGVRPRGQTGPVLVEPVLPRPPRSTAQR